MIKPIITDPERLKIKSTTANCYQVRVVVERDLIDTARHHNALGLAANQIGHLSRVCVVKIDGHYKIFINPEIRPKLTGGKMISLEGCLSLPTKPPTRKKRWKEIFVKDENSEGELVKYKGTVARILQHENDHFDGILI